jgi:branched-chain amino acid transport system ATP-binding protein
VSEAAPILETRGLTIRFGGQAAVNDVSCAFHRGTLTAIVGPNGAGKTTYFNLISGQLRASSGEVLFQLTNLFPDLSVLENVRLAVQARAGIGLHILGMAASHTELAERAWGYLERVTLAPRAAATAAALNHGDQRKLEVAILLALEPAIFMFDEPTAGMSVDEMPVMLDLIEAIRAEGDKTILLVEHKMDVVRRLADRVIVLHQGALVADGLPAEVVASPLVQEAYLGIRPGNHA